MDNRFKVPTVRRSALNAQNLAAFNAALIPGPDRCADDKAHVVPVLQRGFDAPDLKHDKKAIKIKATVG